jgi:hypothetical protein
VEDAVRPHTAEQLIQRLAKEQADSRLPSVVATLRPLGAPGRISHLDLASFCLTRTPYDPVADVPGGVDPAGWGG